MNMSSENERKIKPINIIMTIGKMRSCNILQPQNEHLYRKKHVIKKNRENEITFIS